MNPLYLTMAEWVNTAGILALSAACVLRAGMLLERRLRSRK